MREEMREEIRREEVEEKKVEEKKVEEEVREGMRREEGIEEVEEVVKMEEVEEVEKVDKEEDEEEEGKEKGELPSRPVLLKILFWKPHPPTHIYLCKFVSVQWLDSVMCLPLATRETGSCGLYPT